MCGFDWIAAIGVNSSLQTESGCQPIRWHGNHMASNPSASARRATSAVRAAGGMNCPGTPSVIFPGSPITASAYRMVGRFRQSVDEASIAPLIAFHDALEAQMPQVAHGLDEVRELQREVISGPEHAP